GLSVATGLARRGVSAIALLGRSAPDAQASAVIDELGRGGVRVAVVRGDVDDPAACARAIAAAEGLAPLRGIFHLAGALRDRAFEQLDGDAFKAVFAGKAFGAEALARAARGLSLDAFVLFSSLSAVLGSAGQVNYAAANGYLNGLAQALRADGVPAVSVGWGPWLPAAKAGMAATAKGAGRLGVRPLTDDEALPLLELACAGARPTLVAAAADFDRFAEQVAASPRAAVLSGLAKPPAPKAPGEPAAGGGRARGWLRRTIIEADDREGALRDAIREQICEVLGEDAIDDDAEFVDMGLDSIMSIDLRARLSGALDLDLPATAAIDHPDLASLTRFIMASGALDRPPA
ncbi:MAG TPA: beta-ketoacyl reductase, partial [Polyangiaceae bacterium]|nr:beta-ketoacyl reductase [Polyangiaceae bacterium]